MTKLKNKQDDLSLVKIKELCISLTDDCTSNCDFCNRKMRFQKNYPKDIFYSLVYGSLKENSFREIIENEWKKNDFLVMIQKNNMARLCAENLKVNKNNLFELWNFCTCNLCYNLRKDENFTKKFNFRRKYKTGKLSLDDLKKIISEASELGIKNLDFADEGEPFLEYEKLKELIKFSNGKFKRIGISTNAFFADEMKKALRMLKPLKENGLDIIWISWEPPEKYKAHQHFTPEKNIINIIKAARTINLKIGINSTLTKFPGDEYFKRIEKIEKSTGMKFRHRFMPLNPLTFIYNSIIKLSGNDIYISFIRSNPKVEEVFKDGDLKIYEPLFGIHLKKLYFKLLSILKNNNDCTMSHLLVTVDGLVVACGSNSF